MVDAACLFWKQNGSWVYEGFLQQKGETSDESLSSGLILSNEIKLQLVFRTELINRENHYWIYVRTELKNKKIFAFQTKLRHFIL
jgi:hypothetical protein